MPFGLGDGFEGKLTGINSQLKEAVTHLTKINSLSKDITANLTKSGVAGGGGGGGVSGGGGGGGTSMMPGFGGGLSPKGLAASGVMSMVSGAGKVLGAGAGFLYNGMPDTTKTINYATSYYNASIGQRSSVNWHNMSTATFNGMRGGITAVGNDAKVAEYMSAQGINYSGKAGSQWMGTVAGVANAAKYMNMDNMTAVQAITGLKSGSMSANLMRNFGIMTSDWKTGKTLTQGQIFSQLAQRLTAGNRAATENEVLNSFQRGKLGATLKASGLDETQQQMFAQYMLERARGNNMDLENPEAMKKLMTDAQKNKDINPQQAGMDAMTSDTGLMKAATDTYIKAQQDAVKVIEATNEALKQFIPTAGYLRAFGDTLAGSNGTNAALNAMKDAIAGVTEMLGGLGTLLAGLGLGGVGAGAGSLIGNLFKGGAAAALPETIAAAGSTEAMMGAMGATGTAAAETAAITAGGVLASVAVPVAIGAAAVYQNTKLANAYATPAGKAKIDAQNLSMAKKSAAAGAPLSSGASSGWQNSGGYMYSRGTASSQGAGQRTSPADASSKQVKFMLPVNGPITDRFGMRYWRGAEMHNGLDIGAREGTPIGASADGTVSFVGVWGTGGNTVQIKHANGYTTFYCHQSRTGTTVGKQVKQGEIIGYVGHTGDAFGDHLHFAVQNASGAWIDPESVVNGTVTAVASSGTQPSAETAKKATATAGSAAFASTDSIIDQRAKSKAPAVAGLSMGTSSSAPASTKTNILTNKTSASNGMAASTPGVKSGGGQGIYLQGAPRAKEGDPYVANDGPVNVHAGEAILTAEQANEWRDQVRGVSRGGNGRGANVTINVTVAQASASEARKFASLVKSYIEDDNMVGRMGKH